MLDEKLKEFSLEKRIEALPYGIKKMYFEYNEMFTKKHPEKSKDEIWVMVLNYVSELTKKYSKELGY